MAWEALRREESSFRKRSKMARMKSPAEGGVILSKKSKIRNPKS